jgi:hypothetical protein
MTACLRALLFALLFALPTLAPAQSRRSITGEGTEGFRALLAGKGLHPLGSIEDLNKQMAVDPSKVLIVYFHGTNAAGQELPDGLDQFEFDLKRDFVDRGGALWVATDRPLPRRLADATGATVFRAIIAARNPALAYKGNPNCPYVTQVPGSVPNLFAQSGDHPDSLTRVATNRPAYLRGSAELDDLGIFERGTWRFEGESNELNDVLPRLHSIRVAQGHKYDNGAKVLVLADHSIFINSMLLPRGNPNDNLRFASNCVDWLMTGPSRNYVLFMEDGHIYQRDDYDLILQSMPQPRPEDIAEFLWENKDLLWKNTDLAEEVLSKMEEDGIFEEVEKSGMIGGILDDILEPWMVARFVVIAGAVGLFGYAVLQFAGSRHRVPKRVARLSLLLDRMRPRTGLLELRLRSGLGRGRYYELARHRAREMFADLKLTPAEEGPMPTVEIDAGWWRRGRILRDLRDVWAVAFGREPVPVTGKAWDSFQRKLSQIEVMIRHGAIRFQ